MSGVETVVEMLLVIWFVYINACVDNHRTRLKALEKEIAGKS